MSAKDEEIKIRVPGAMKSAIKALASKRYTSESEIAREALLEYLRSRNIELREYSEPATAAPSPPEKPVSYLKPKRKANSKMAAAEAEVAQIVESESAVKQKTRPKPVK
jgi:Arc/MetJ-type ribon-helix-helix transcriptional regulator